MKMASASTTETLPGTFEGLDDPLKPATPSEICPLLRISEERGLKLSWPHAGDARRSQVGKSTTTEPIHGPQSSQHDSPHMVHVSSRDVAMHYQFSGSEPGSGRPVLEVPLPWNPISEQVGHEELFEYFRHTASKALPVFGHDASELGNALIRIALSGKTTLSTAVIQSILAFSALVRHNVNGQAVELKISALKILQSASTSQAMSPTEGAQHVAAGMLLCSFEVHQASCTSGEWTWYLRGVKDVIRASGLDMVRQDADVAMLLDWVYYHDVLARFSLRHRRKDFEGMSLHCPATAKSRISENSPTSLSSVPSSVRSEPSKSAPPAIVLIELLSNICDAVSQPTPQTADHKTFLKILDWRIRTTAIPATPQDTPDTPVILELYQLALLVYINRANPKLQPPAKTQQHVDRAFELIPRVRACDRQFPVFVLGCEARSDEQRSAVLDLIARTERGVSSRSFNYVRILLQAVWAQDDLAAGGEVDYLQKISFVISCCRILPTFV
ncbi:fungal-specific transcription factor domain-containing protein [Coniochaeta sp. 2T2.1]|nr:fungal-specific transcription factor domain-containing protein [Coniochaeta sp. 2T2.1]